MNKKIVRTVVVVVIAVLVIAAVVLHEKNKNTQNNNETTTVTQTTADANGKTDEQANDTKEYATLEDITETTGDSETNYFDNVTIYEGEGTTKKASSNKNNKKKNKETESEAYEGQNDGWSPVVSPEDLEQ